MNYGDLIKTRRKALDITQKELAQGICTQAMISKIERNELNPSMDIMYKISDQLHIPISLFYGGATGNTDDESKINQFKAIIRKQLQQRQYAAIDYLIHNNNEILNNNLSKENKMFFDWMRGILYHYLHNDSEKAIQHLKNIDLEDPANNSTIEILNSLGNLYYEKNELDRSQIFFEEAVLCLNETIRHEVKIKLIFNHALCLKDMKKNGESLQLIVGGIDLNVESNSLYLLGDLLYQKGLILAEMEEYLDAIEPLQTAINIFRLQNNENFETKAKLLLIQSKNNDSI